MERNLKMIRDNVNQPRADNDNPSFTFLSKSEAPTKLLKTPVSYKNVKQAYIWEMERFKHSRKGERDSWKTCQIYMSSQQFACPCSRKNTTSFVSTESNQA